MPQSVMIHAVTKSPICPICGKNMKLVKIENIDDMDDSNILFIYECPNKKINKKGQFFCCEIADFQYIPDPSEIARGN